MWGGVIDWIKSINNSFRRHLKTSTKRFYLYFYFSLISFKFKCRNFRWHLYRMCGWQHVIQHVENSIFKIRTYWMLWHCSFSNLFNTFVFLFSFILFLKCAPEKKKRSKNHLKSITRNALFKIDFESFTLQSM